MEIFYGIIMKRKVIKFSIRDIQIVYKPIGYGLCTSDNNAIYFLSGEYHNQSFPIIHTCTNEIGAVIFDIKEFFTTEGIDENIKKHYEHTWHQTYNLYYPNERKYEEITDKTKINKCRKSFDDEKTKNENNNKVASYKQIEKCKILIPN